MALPRLAPRLAISLPLSGLVLAAQASGWPDAAAVLAAALIGAMAAPTPRGWSIAATAAAAGGAMALALHLPGATQALLGALPLAGNLLLAWHFGATLRPGREPLITRYTRAEQGFVAPGMAVYTRRLTWLWTMFFLAFATANLLTLAGIGPAPGPSAVANVALSLLLFLGEHPVRRALFPGVGPATPLSTLRAIWRADVHAG
jgi:uncharacterized membrane protein